ncbi:MULTISPECIES: ComEA family DNA-binding protein [Grimontia]|uniref:ComE operon protein 1 n=1 Tax=Grimontia marina TaxID=646534 RepID=A0A128ERV8_9GAMM|nr:MULTISPECIES: ComEA family DNA-binding protein [Grimontia]WRV97547.1 ComEA family DNA-binding protein [Grimontia sp. NTOU-MAR1]CZF77378.1 ComE operon protein 1 [Grimontia marina]
MKSILSAIFFAITLILSPLASAQDGALVAPAEVNINTAEVEELDKYLDGVGKAKAQAIVDYRNTNGAFESADDLKGVKGIGDSIVEKNRDRIVL